MYWLWWIRRERFLAPLLTSVENMILCIKAIALGKGGRHKEFRVLVLLIQAYDHS